VTGHSGGALSLDGVDDNVALGSLGTFYNSAFTLEAWVRKTTTKKDVGVVGTWAGSGPMLWIDHVAGHHYATLGSSLSSYLDSGQSPLVGQWQHLAATFDGTTARYYIDGTAVASRAVSGSVGSSDVWRIGAYGSSPGGFLDGTVDDVRIYNRALSAGEVQFDRDHGVTPPGATRLCRARRAHSRQPGDESGLARVGRRDRQHRGHRLQRAPLDHVRLHTFDLEPDRTADGPELHGHRARGGTYYYKVTAQDAAGNVGPASNEASASVTVADTTLPTASITAPAAGATLSGRHDDQRHGDGQRRGRRSAVPSRRREHRRRGSDGAVLHLLGHARGPQRLPHADRRRTRHERQHGTSGSVP
jgi:hypothetical protein